MRTTPPAHPADRRGVGYAGALMTRATILFAAPDRPGLVAKLSSFFADQGLATDISETVSFLRSVKCVFDERCGVAGSEGGEGDKRIPDRPPPAGR